MPLTTTDSKVAQTFPSVKSSIPHPLYPRPNSMIHHKDYTPIPHIIYKSKGEPLPIPYGVSSSFRVLAPSLFIKKYDLVCDCLKSPLGMTAGQCEVTLRLLRLFVYYGSVYPKESQITGGMEEQPNPQSWEQWYRMSTPPRPRGCSKATFWRTIKLLEKLGLVQVINRYINRPHAQISNLYLLYKLIIVIARYLAEHGQAFHEKWLEPYLVMPGHLFWGAKASTFWPSGET